MINWKVTKKDRDIIVDIAARASALAKTHGIEYPVRDALMDLTAVHANGCPLRLEVLAQFPPFDFSHDVFGIRRHIDRTTGELKDCFVPRCAV